MRQLNFSAPFNAISRFPLVKTLRLLALLFSLTVAGNAFAADALDFPAAVFRVKIGTQTATYRAADAGKEIKIDGHDVRTGEVISSAVKIAWIAAPSVEVGDEYVFIVRRPNQKPKTYSVVFKGGYSAVVSAEDLSIEIEN